MLVLLDYYYYHVSITLAMRVCGSVSWLPHVPAAGRAYFRGGPTLIIFTCYHTEIEVTDQAISLNPYTDTVSQGWTCSDRFTCYHTEIEVYRSGNPAHSTRRR